MREELDAPRVATPDRIAQLFERAVDLPEDERIEMLAGLGLGEGALPRLVRAAHAVLDRRTKIGKRYHFSGMIEEFHKTLLAELDYRREANHLTTLADNLSDFDRIVVPRPVPDYSTARVITMDFIPGSKINSLSPVALLEVDGDELAEAVAEQLLARWGVVFRDLLARDTVGVPWREVLWALRRMEARGLIRGGRFVSGFSGEQYAAPEAVEMLRSVRKLPHADETVRIAAADPLNLVGIVLPGPRVPALPHDSVTYVDGVPPTVDAVARAFSG